MRFIVNKKDTAQWHEISPDTLIDWAKDDDENKVRVQLAKDFIKKARHGEIFVYGVNRVMAVDLD